MEYPDSTSSINSNANLDYMLLFNENFFDESTDHDDEFFQCSSDVDDPFFNETDDVHNNYIDSGPPQKIFSSPTQIFPNLPSNQNIESKCCSGVKTNAETPSQSEVSMNDFLSRRSTHRSSKRKVSLSYKADDFKKLFYQIFTSKKRFQKELIKKIHDIIFIPLHLKKMTREEFRRIDLYFQEYAKFGDQILIYLQKHKEELLTAIPELSQLK